MNRLLFDLLVSENLDNTMVYALILPSVVHLFELHDGLIFANFVYRIESYTAL